MKKILQKYIVLGCLTIMLSSFGLYSASESVDYSASYLVEDLTRYAPEQQIHYLNTGSETFLALLQQQRHGFAKGVIFVVPEIFQPVARQVSYNNWHNQLTEIGWTSLLITMPHRQYNSLDLIIEPIDENEDKSADDTEQTSNEDNEISEDEEVELSEEEKTALREQQLELLAKPPVSNLRPDFVALNNEQHDTDDIHQAMLSRLNSALEFGQQQPGFFVFACEGRSCIWLTQLFAEAKLATPDALIMLNSFVAQPKLKQQFHQQLATLEFPVLDIYRDPTYSWKRAQPKERKVATKRAFKTDYRQRQLSSYLDHQLLKTRTYKEVYGFLTAMGM